MKYSVDKENGKAYLQIYEQIKKDIVDGVYANGAKLMSKRLLAEEIGVSVITVEHAYSLLYDEGYIDSRERSGYFVSYSADSTFVSPEISLTREAAHARFCENNNDFPFSVYAKTVRRVLSDYGEDIFASSGSSGCDELKNAIRSYLKRSRGIDVENSQIVIGAGSEYLYGIIVQMLGKNRIYALENPSYEKIGKVYRANGVKTLYLSLLKDGISSEELKNTIASVLHITPYRSYPSRVSADASKKREYIRWARQDNRIIVEDDFESEFTLLTVTQKNAPTIFCPPIGHVQKSGDYRESWQPYKISEQALAQAQHMADQVTKALTGYGIWGVEFFLTKQGEVIFSELSPRPHDTGMVTLGHTTNLSEFELHFRAIMGLPIADIRLEHAGASAVVLSPIEKKGPLDYNLVDALKEECTRVRIFGKPEAHPGRRMGVVLCYGDTDADTDALRNKAKRLAKTVLGTDPYAKIEH